MNLENILFENIFIKEKIPGNIFKIVYKLLTSFQDLRNITGILREEVLLNQEEEEFMKKALLGSLAAVLALAGCNG